MSSRQINTASLQEAGKQVVKHKQKRKVHGALSNEHLQLAKFVNDMIAGKGETIHFLPHCFLDVFFDVTRCGQESDYGFNEITCEMVSAIALMSEIQNLVEEVYKNEELADKDRWAEYHSTNVIKAWFRGYSTRKKLSIMNDKATTIQKYWRGFLGRRRFRRKLNERVRELALECFNKTATKIQSCWRGYYTRKYVADYYLRKMRLKALDETNKEIRKTISCYAESIRLQCEQREQEQKAAANLAWAESHHYLVSTNVQFGIFNSPYLPAPQPQEYLLLETRPRQPPIMDLKKYKREDLTWKSYNEPSPVQFPKLPSIKPQGPFREPAAVIKQRLKPLKPTLRVETDYESEVKAQKALEAEEWLGRVHDAQFLYFYKSAKFYDPLIWTKSDFRKIKYGSETFRDDSGIDTAMRQRMNEGFRTILPPIPVFEKFGQTYSQGEV